MGWLHPFPAFEGPACQLLFFLKGLPRTDPTNRGACLRRRGRRGGEEPLLQYQLLLPAQGSKLLLLADHDLLLWAQVAKSTLRAPSASVAFEMVRAWLALLLEVLHLMFRPLGVKWDMQHLRWRRIPLDLGHLGSTPWRQLVYQIRYPHVKVDECLMDWQLLAVLKSNQLMPTTWLDKWQVLILTDIVAR